MILIQKFKHSFTSSGGALAKSLGLKVYSKKVSPKNKKVSAINWGLSSIPWLSEGSTILNKPLNIGIACNKLKAFMAMDEVVSIPFFTNDINIASSLFDCHMWEQKPAGYKHKSKIKVVCRTKLTGHSGEGIVIAHTPEELVEAPLYTLYIEKKWEYRVHVLQRSIITVQQKRRRTTEQLEERGITNRNKYIRNLENGYIFSTTLDHPVDSEIYTLLSEQAVSAISSIGLDFGAVDLVVTNDGQVFVLEVNTAPGLQGETLNSYISFFRALL